MRCYLLENKNGLVILLASSQQLKEKSCCNGAPKEGENVEADERHEDTDMRYREMYNFTAPIPVQTPGPWDVNEAKIIQ